MACSSWKQRTIYILKLMVCVSLMPCSALEITCNDRGVAEVGSPAKLICSTSSKTTFFFCSPTTVEAASCTLHGNCRSEDDRYKASFLNATTTQLDIVSTQTADAGNWTCRDVNAEINDRVSCRLVVMKSPSCSITSDNNTETLDVNGELTLSVNVTNYYCSMPTELLLKTGDHTVEINSSYNVDTVISDVFNLTFIVTESHIGNLELHFICNSAIKRVACRGVTELFERLPSCTISCDKATNELTVDEELSLTVYSEARNCSRNTVYLLQTGKLNRTLSGTFRETVTFRMTKSHFGLVYLKLICNDISRKVQCRGIKELTASQGSVKVGVLWCFGVFLFIGMLIAVAIKVLKKRPECVKVKAKMDPNEPNMSEDLNKQVSQSYGNNPPDNQSKSIPEESLYSSAWR